MLRIAPVLLFERLLYVFDSICFSPFEASKSRMGVQMLVEVCREQGRENMKQQQLLGFDKEQQQTPDSLRGILGFDPPDSKRPNSQAGQATLCEAKCAIARESRQRMLKEVVAVHQQTFFFLFFLKKTF